MPTIRATCSDCGDVELTTSDVRVRVCIEDNQGSYHFRCPTCLMAVVKSAEPRIVDLLVASGVELSTWHLPEELLEPKVGPALTHDDAPGCVWCCVGVLRAVLRPERVHRPVPPRRRP